MEYIEQNIKIKYLNKLILHLSIDDNTYIHHQMLKIKINFYE